MNRIAEILSNLEESLINTGIRYCASYVPSSNAYTLTIHFRENERRCCNCAYWGEDETSMCATCDNHDNFKPLDNNA